MRVVITTACVLLIGCASKPPAPAPAPAPPQARLSNPVIVKLVSRKQTVTVTSGPNGPLYAVTDAAGREILAPMPLNEIANRDPVLYGEIKSALASDASADGVRMPVNNAAR